MDQARMIQRLETNLETINLIFADISTEEVRWKPEPEKWSMLEVLNHLCDEERDDFRKRLRLILENPGIEWPPIDPVGWAKKRDYNGSDLSESLESFNNERKASLEWLRSLQNPNWDIEYNHPILGSIKAGDLFASWITHDFLHLRQLANVIVQHTIMIAKPYSAKYAAP